MTRPRISDHALVRWLERAGGLEIEELREQLAASLERAHTAAVSVGAFNYLIKADGLIYAVRDGVVTTVLEDRDVHASAIAAAYRPAPRLGQPG